MHETAVAVNAAVKDAPPHGSLQVGDEAFLDLDKVSASAKSLVVKFGECAKFQILGIAPIPIKKVTPPHTHLATVRLISNGKIDMISLHFLSPDPPYIGGCA